MGLTLVTPATDYAVTLAEAKAHCRVDHADEDTHIQGLIAAATDYVGQYLGRSITEQTWRLSLNDFSDVMILPMGPVSEVSSVKYDDSANAEQTLSTGFTVDLASDPQRVVRDPDFSWPDVYDGTNKVRIEYVAGYSSIPASIKHAVLLLIGQWFDNRSATNVGNITSELPHGIAALLTNHRSFAF